MPYMGQMAARDSRGDGIWRTDPVGFENSDQKRGFFGSPDEDLPDGFGSAGYVLGGRDIF